MADALKCNKVLGRFELAVHGAAMDNDTGVAMADALRGNMALWRFQLSVGQTGVCDITGIAMADALKHNIVLQYFSLEAFATGINRVTEDAMVGALKHNVVLQYFDFSVCFDGELVSAKRAYIDRNRAIRQQRLSLTCLSKCAVDAGFQSLVEVCFRARVLKYHLPASCNLQPIEFVGGEQGHVVRSVVVTE